MYREPSSYFRTFWDLLFVVLISFSPFIIFGIVNFTKWLIK